MFDALLLLLQPSNVAPLPVGAGGVKVISWRFGTVNATLGVTQPFIWDNPNSKWDSMCWDVTAIGSSIGVTETVPVFFISSATIIIPRSTQQSGQPINVTA